MKKNCKLLVFSLIVLALAFCCSFVTNKPVFAENQDVIVKDISSVEDLKKIGEDGNFPLSNVVYTLQSNIELTDDWSPISEFSGTFDGNGFKISGLKISSNAYEIGLFASTKNAIIKNLAIEDVSISLSDVLQDIPNGKIALYAGGLAGKMENTKIENCYVSFKENELTQSSENAGETNSDDDTNTSSKSNSLTGQTSFYFGGIAGEMSLGCSIKNSYSNINMEIEQSGSQNATIIAGGICGNFTSSSIANCFSYGTLMCLQTSDELIENTGEINLGGIIGYVSGYNSQIINTYFSGNLTARSDAQIPVIYVGGSVGKVALTSSLTPKFGNMNYAYAYVKNDAEILNFGNSNNYDISNLTIVKMTQDNFALFENNEAWSEFEPWDFKYNFSSHLNAFPSLQRFNVYSLILNEDKTIIDLGDGVTSSEKPVSLSFVEKFDNDFKYDEQVNILIEINENFAPFYTLNNILVNNSIVYALDSNNDVYTLVENEENKGVYVFSYKINDQTNGEISVALEKIPYTINVKTDDSLMGKVRNQFSVTTYGNFEQNILNGNVYRFFAVPINANFAFLRWVVETVDENEEIVETPLDQFPSSQLSFRFGMSGDEADKELTNLLIAGGKLSAVFSSNVCKLEIQCKLSNGDVEKNAGKLFIEVDGVKTEYNEITSVIKNKEIILSFEANEGYKFVGWYSENSPLEANETCALTLEEDQFSVYAKFEKIDDVKNLTTLWIILGSVGGVLLIGGVIWIILAKKKDNAYKNFY